MQKICVAIVFALALSSVVADFTPSNDGWAKTPVSACDDTNVNCTNRTVLALTGLTQTDVNIISYASPVPVDVKNTSSANWNLWTKVVDTKALTSTSNTSYTFKATQDAQVGYGYAVGVAIANDSSNIPQIWFYQTKLVGATELPRVQLSSNKDANYTPAPLGFTGNGKTFYFFYAATTSKVNFTSVTLGGSTIGKEFTLTTTFNSSTGKLEAETGEALSSSQAYVGWTEGDAYKVAAADFSSGTLSGSATLGNYNKNYTCAPYVTDKKLYGVWCTNPNNGSTEIYVSANTTSLLKLNTVNSTTQAVQGTFPYSGYLGFFYQDGTTSNATVLSYDIWDVNAFKGFKNKTNYLTYDPATSSKTEYRIPGAGIYSILYNNAKDVNSTKTKVQVGLLLEGSYLTTIFGSLMTIIAGLLLF